MVMSMRLLTLTKAVSRGHDARGLVRRPLSPAPSPESEVYLPPITGFPETQVAKIAMTSIVSVTQETPIGPLDGVS